MIETDVKDEGLLPMLARVVAGLQNPTALFQELAGTLADETEKNFAAQGRPQWLGLKPPVNPRRAGGKILQDSGQLAASVVTDYGRDFARVGSNKVYAQIHQLGGTTSAHVILPKHAKALAFNGRVVKRVQHPGSEIPARPFMPFEGTDKIQPAAEPALRADVQRWLQSLVG